MISVKPEGKNVFSLLKSAERILKEANINEAKTDSEVLLSSILNIKRNKLAILRDKEISKDELFQFENHIKRRLKREPVAYIVGSCGFMDYEFVVNKDVLIPRSETELLVEETIKTAEKFGKKTILDLCTGSGCIAVALSKSGIFNKVYASDISQKALNVAKINAKNNKADEINFIESDIFGNLKDIKVDIIISNPPYISSEEYDKLEPELFFEPKTALLADGDATSFYKEIAEKSKSFLNKSGFVLLELSSTNASIIETIFKEKNYKNIEILKDYSGFKRILKAEI